MLASKKIAKYRQEKGENTLGLGRWVWKTIEGYLEVKSVIIQIYRLTHNTKNNRSTYIQQRG